MILYLTDLDSMRFIDCDMDIMKTYENNVFHITSSQRPLTTSGGNFESGT